MAQYKYDDIKSALLQIDQQQNYNSAIDLSRNSDEMLTAWAMWSNYGAQWQNISLQTAEARPPKWAFKSSNAFSRPWQLSCPCFQFGPVEEEPAVSLVAYLSMEILHILCLVLVTLWSHLFRIPSWKPYFGVRYASQKGLGRSGLQEVSPFSMQKKHQGYRLPFWEPLVLEPLPELMVTQMT